MSDLFWLGAFVAFMWFAFGSDMEKVRQDVERLRQRIADLEERLPKKEKEPWE